MGNKTSPLITVLMSVHNNEKTVGRAINSILNQSFGNFEFLIINDASTDNTSEVIKSYNDDRINIVNNKKNLGLTRSLNKGLRKARGKYLARIDADDISLTSRLKKQVNFMVKNPEFTLLGTSFNIINNKNQIVKEVKFNTTPEKLYYDLIFQNMFAHSSVIFKLDEALKVGGYNETYKYSQDYDLWHKLANIGKAWVLSDILTLWHDDPDNISGRKAKEQKLASVNIFKKNLKELGVREDIIRNASYLHNFYGNEFICIPGEKIHTTFKALLSINNEIVLKAPAFYRKNILEDMAYQSVIDLLTRIYKDTNNKLKVTSFLARNLFNLKLDMKVLQKIANFIKEKIVKRKE